MNSELVPLRKRTPSHPDGDRRQKKCAGNENGTIYGERERETAGTKASSLPATIGLGDAYQIAGQTRVQSHPSLSCPLALLVSQRNREINFSRREPSFILFIDFFFLFVLQILNYIRDMLPFTVWSFLCLFL